MTLEEFFQNLTASTIDGLIRDRQEEHLSLDFKTVSNANLSSGGDKRNFAEILSGFANSAGGVVIWGVATEKNADHQDVAVKRALIPGVAAFVNRLDEATALLVTPPVNGVRNRAIEITGGEGFAATLVPESDSGPHMALAGHDRYFKRAGDRFYRMEHFDIADMFGRRQRPAFGFSYSVQPGSSYGGPEGSRKEVRILITIRNEGRASAVAPYIRFQVPVGFRMNALGPASSQTGAALQFVPEAVQPPAASIIGRSDFIIHPHASVQIAEITKEIRGNEDVPDCTVKYSAAALNSVLVEGSFVVPPIEIASRIERTVRANGR
jgi:schlafen family protein